MLFLLQSVCCAVAVPPPGIVGASFFSPNVPTTINQVAVVEIAMDDVNADPSLLPGVTLDLSWLQEPPTRNALVRMLDTAHVKQRDCLTFGIADARRADYLAPVVSNRNSNHLFFFDFGMSAGVKYPEYASTMGLFGWGSIVARYLDMMASMEIKRFAVVMPKSFEAMGQTFLVAERTRDMAVAYYHVFDEAVTGSVSHDNAVAYAAQVVKEIVNSKTTVIFFCFCLTVNTEFKVAFLRSARDAGLMGKGYQWFSHYQTVSKFMETFMYLPEYADLLPLLAHFKVVHQPALEPADYSATQAEVPGFSRTDLDAHLKSAVAAKFSKALPNRGFTGMFKSLNCTATPTLKVCTMTPDITKEIMRTVMYDAVFNVARALHQLLIVDGQGDFCNVDSEGVRSGPSQLFREKLMQTPWSGYSGVRPWLDVPAAGGTLSSLGATFQLADWVPRANTTYSKAKTIDMYANRLTGEVIHRDWATGIPKPVEDLRWMGGATTPPLDYIPEMCGKTAYIDMTSAAKRCLPCPEGTFNHPADMLNECIEIATFKCAAGEFFEKVAAAGSGTANPCKPCRPGSHQQKASGSEDCELCPLGRYQPHTGQSECLPCNDGFTTPTLGSTEVSQCHCPENHLLLEDLTCGACDPKTTLCPGLMAESNITSLPGFVVISGKSLAGGSTHAPDVGPFENVPRAFACISQAECEGERLPGQCTAGHAGVACGACEEGFSRSEGRCRSCSAADGSRIVGTVFFFLGYLALVVSMVRIVGNPKKRYITASLSLATILGVFVSYLQLTSLLGGLELDLPPGLAEIVEVLQVFNLDLSVIKFDCVYGRSVQAAILQKPLILFATFALLAGVWSGANIIKNRLVPSSPRRVLLNCIGFTTNISFVPIAMNGFSMFNCYPHPDGGSSMVLLPDVLCYEDVWTSQILPWGAVSLSVSCLSFTILAFLAYTSPTMGQATQNVSFLLARFRPESYTWNTCMLTRNLILAAAPSLSHNSYLKIFIMTVVLISYGSAVLVYRPWKIPIHNNADFCSTVALMLTLCASAGMSRTPGFQQSGPDQGSAAWDFLRLAALVPFLVTAVLIVALMFVTHRTRNTDIHKERFDSMLNLLFKTAKSTTQVAGAPDKRSTMLALENNSLNLSLYDMEDICKACRLVDEILMGKFSATSSRSGSKRRASATADVVVLGE